MDHTMSLPKNNREVVYQTREDASYHLGQELASHTILYVPQLSEICLDVVGGLFLSYLAMREVPAAEPYCGLETEIILKRLGCSVEQFLLARERLMRQGFLDFTVRDGKAVYRVNRWAIDQAIEGLGSNPGVSE